MPKVYNSMIMKRVHLLPNVVTAFGLSCGLFVIFKLNMTALGGATAEVLTQTAGILLLAVIADLLDGGIARAMGAESEFGGFFDSMADAITFGVAPSVIVLKSFSVEPGTELSFFLTTSAMVFSVCGVLRLVRFNVSAQNAKENKDLLSAHKKNFTGLPIPGAAAAAVSFNLFLVSSAFNRYFSITEELRASLLVFVMIFLGYLMVCRWKFPSFKTLRLKVFSFQQVFLIVLVAAVIFYGIMHHFSTVFFIFSWGYIFVAMALSLIRLISGKRAKGLEDFDPAPDDIEFTD